MVGAEEPQEGAGELEVRSRGKEEGEGKEKARERTLICVFFPTIFKILECLVEWMLSSFQPPVVCGGDNDSNDNNGMIRVTFEY